MYRILSRSYSIYLNARIFTIVLLLLEEGDEEVDEAIDMATNNDDLVDLDYDEDGSDVDDIDDSVDSDSGDDEDDGSVVVDSDVIDTRPSHEDAVEILVDDEEDLLTTEEEKEKRGGLGTSSALQTDTM